MNDDLVSNLELVLRGDPALDRTSMDMTRYLETRDPALIRENPGMRATRFTIRALDVNEWRAVSAQRPGFPMASAAVELALVSVDGPSLSFRGTKEIDTGLGVNRTTMSPRDLNELFTKLGSVKLGEIGVAIIDRAEQGNGDGCGVRFTLPQPWPDAPEAKRLQHAGQTREKSETKT